MAEIHTPLQFREEANLPSRGWAQNYQRRTQEVADESGIGTLEARKLKSLRRPTFSDLLNATTATPTFLARGLATMQCIRARKAWASIMTHELQQLAGTATEMRAEYKVTVSYRSLALVLHAAWQLMRVVCQRYTTLAIPLQRLGPITLGWAGREVPTRRSPRIARGSWETECVGSRSSASGRGGSICGEWSQLCRLRRTRSGAFGVTPRERANV